MLILGELLGVWLWVVLVSIGWVHVDGFHGIRGD